LFKDVRLKSSGAVVEKHLWISLGKQMASVLADQKSGVMIEFVASVDGSRITGDPGFVPIRSRLALERPRQIKIKGALDGWCEELTNVYRKTNRPGR